MDKEAKQVLEDLVDWIFETYKIHKALKLSDDEEFKDSFNKMNVFNTIIELRKRQKPNILLYQDMEYVKKEVINGSKTIKELAKNLIYAEIGCQDEPLEVTLDDYRDINEVVEKSFLKAFNK